MTGTLVLSGSTPLQVTTTSPGAGKVLVSDAAGNVSWGSVAAPLTLSSAQAAAAILAVTNTTGSPTKPVVQLTASTGGDQTVGLQVSGDPQQRLLIDSNGVHSWGPGNAASDTNLYRSASGVLRTDNTLVVATRLGVGAATTPGVTLDVAAAAAGPVLRVTDSTSAPTSPIVSVVANAAADNSVGVQVTGDTQQRLLVDSNGRLQWGPGNAALDTNLYRSGASQLSTDDSLGAALGVQVGSATPAFGGGSGVLGLSNAGVVPNTNPASGLVLYSTQDSPRWRSSNGDVYSGNGAWRDDLLRPSGAIAETMSRLLASNSLSPTSGVLTLTPIWLPKGVTISNISWANGNTAGATLTHQWAALYNSARLQLAVTADKTTSAVPINTVFTWAIATIASGSSTTFVTTYTGLYYLGLMIAATTLPAPVAAGGPVAAGNLAPTFGNSDTSQTTPPAFPHTAATPNQTAPNYYYMYVS